MSDKIVDGTVAVVKTVFTGWPPALLAVILLNILMVGAIWLHENQVVASEEKVALQRMGSMEELIRVCINDHNTRKQGQGQNN
jgi:hypothetical protein